MVSSIDQSDSELFCNPATAKPHMQPRPERHPSTLIPGGHTSPLRHPTILRPGAAGAQHAHHHHHMRKSSENLRSQTPRPPTAQQQAPKQPIYKAYSPAATNTTTPSDPRASVIASEIEGYFTALNVAPLHVTKKQSEGQPSSPPTGRESPIQRCASPPVPPKVKLEQEEEARRQSPLPGAETPGEEHDATAETEECPPAYDEARRVPPPPEKAPRTFSPVSSDDSRAGCASASVSAARVMEPAAGPGTDEAPAQDTADDAAHTDTDTDTPDGDEANQADDDDYATTATTRDEEQQQHPTATASSGAPPPLPPRSTSVPQEIQPDPQAFHTPGAFPPPPKRTPPPPRSSSPPQGSGGVTGAAASSATAVGAAVAMPSSDFAHNGLRQARHVLGRHVKHAVDRAKEHHEQHLAKKTAGSRAGIVGEDGRGRNILVIAPVA